MSNYLGRHSSKKDPDKDSYRGSGKWVKSIKDKSRLSIVILETYDTFEELVAGEQLYLDWYINDPIDIPPCH